MAEDSQTAEQHDTQARAYFRAGAFVLAAREFAKAYELDKESTRLFNAALAYEKADEQRKAAEYYGKYLAADPTGDKSIESRARKAALDKAIADADQSAAEAALKAARDKEEASHVAVASDHLSAGRYAEAAQSFGAAYEVNKDVQYIFEKAEAERQAGMNTEAIASYRAYQREAPEGPKFSKAEERQDDLEEQVRRTKHTDASGIGTTPSSPLVSAQQKDTDSRATPGRGLRLAGITTATIGGALVAFAVSQGLAAQSHSDDAHDAAEERQIWDTDAIGKLNDAEAAEQRMYIGYGVGAGALVAGAVLYYLGHRAREGASPGRATATARLVSGGALLSLEGAF